MDSKEEATSVSIHTLDTLCDELVSGRPVKLDDSGEIIQFSSNDARAVFSWYCDNPDKWGGQNRTEDVEQIAARIGAEPPEIPSPEGLTQEDAERKLYLKSLRTHRFAGIQRYGTPEAAPPPFQLDFDSPATPTVLAVQGNNGAGKTSLLSAIVWCLTGHIYRSQRPPETEEVRCALSVPQGEPSEPPKKLDSIPAVSPIPTADVLEALGKKVPLDTWVELTFVDENGEEFGPFRRTLSRSPRGAPRVDKPDFSSLGVSPIALEIGTRMSGLLPYIQLGEQSDLGSAVAELTGLSPLKDLVGHAVKSRKKLRGELKSKCEGSISQLDLKFEEERKELAHQVSLCDAIDNVSSIPAPASTDCEKELSTVLAQVRTQYGNALDHAKNILGDEFDPNDKETRKGLVADIGPAIVAISQQALGQLKSARELNALRRLTSEQLKDARSRLERIERQAAELADLEQAPELFARKRLYAKVAEWLGETEPNTASVPQHCPVCQSGLGGCLDPVSNEPVASCIEEFLKSDQAHLQYTLERWADETRTKLAGELCDGLTKYRSIDLPSTPTDLIRTALADDLFDAKPFHGVLAPLKTGVVALYEAHLSQLGQFEEPLPTQLPLCLETHELATVIRRVERAIAFAEWRQENADACGEAFRAIIGDSETDVDTQTEEIADSPLAVRLSALNRLVNDAEPLRSADLSLMAMERALSERRAQQTKIETYKKAADALAELDSLETLVDEQVDGLVAKLGDETRKWKDKLYTPAYTGGPTLASLSVQSTGVLGVQAEHGGTLTSAQHVCNASDLRATLLAFLFAYWHHLVKTQGGIALLLFDDLHELFDPPNRRRIASAVHEMAAEGARIVVTTNEETFLRAMRVSASGEREACLDHRHLHPSTKIMPVVRLSPHSDALEQLRDKYEANENDERAAQEYVGALRVYCESRLMHLLDVPDPCLPEKPTFGSILGAVQRYSNSGHEPFSSAPIRALLESQVFQTRSQLRDILNRAHHHTLTGITCGEVEQIANDAKTAKRLVDSAHVAYERHLRRDHEPRRAVGPIHCIARDLHFSVPSVEALAAADGESIEWQSDESGESFECDWLANHAAFVNCTDHLGFAGRPGCRLIVDANGESVESGSWVVARCNGRTYVRRLMYSEAHPNQLILASETSDPTQRAPTVYCKATDTTVSPVVGVFLDGNAWIPSSREEAIEDRGFDLASLVQIAFRIRGDSAVPLALDGQTVLGSEELRSADLGSHEDELVAVSTSDGAYFKRVGKTLPGAPHVRLFESIGGQGDSKCLRTEKVEDDPYSDLPIVTAFRQIVGVLYKPGT